MTIKTKLLTSLGGVLLMSLSVISPVSSALSSSSEQQTFDTNTIENRVLNEVELKQKAIKEAKKEELMASVSDEENIQFFSSFNCVKESNQGVDNELQKKLDALDAEEEKLNKKDILAYPILTKYYGDEYERTTLIEDYDTDVSYMLQMITLLESQSATKDEVEILKEYLSRREYWITDDSLKSKINSALNKIK